MIKALQKAGIEGTYLNILKRSYIMTKWALSQGCKDSSIFANLSM